MEPYLAKRPVDPAENIRGRWGLRAVINCSGNNTALGASSVLPCVIDACAEIMPEFVDITDLHRKASQTIARVFETEAGTVCGSLASGIAVSVAGCITGADLSIKIMGVSVIVPVFPVELLPCILRAAQIEAGIHGDIE